MSDNASTTPQAANVTEVVGRFADRESFRQAVEDLRNAGFEASDLSVLDGHVALSASEDEKAAWGQTLTGLLGEIHYIGPLTAAGLIAIASGPVGAAVAGLLAAGVTGAALKEAFDEIKATPHTEAFAKAVENGALLLWVRAEDEALQTTAKGVLTRHGAADVHLHQRAP